MVYFLMTFYASHVSGLLEISYNREHAPSIIFMDEIDSIGSARMESGSGNGDSEVQRTMLELLNQLDGFEASNKIKVISLPMIYGETVILLLGYNCVSIATTTK